MFPNWLHAIFSGSSAIRNRRRKPRSLIRPNVVQLEDRVVPAVTADLVGGVLTVTLDAANDAAFLRVVDGKVEVDDEPTFTGPQVVGSPFDGVTKIVIVDAGDNPGQSVTLTGDKTFNLTAGLHSTGVETVSIAADINAADDVININASQNIVVSGSLTTTSGHITLAANQGAMPATGNFVGIDVDGGVIQTGTGKILIQGRGGDSGGNNVGVQVAAKGKIQTTANGTVTVIGTGGTGSGNLNIGVRVTGDGSQISSNGGNVTVTGTGSGTDTSTNNFGVLLTTGGLISAGGGGDVIVTGQGGGTDKSDGGNIGVFLFIGGKISVEGGGTATVVGTGGSAGVAGNNPGFAIQFNGQVSASGGGNVNVIGSGGTGGSTNDGVSLVDGLLNTSDGGAISVTGTPGDGPNSIAVSALGNSQILSKNAPITVVGDSMDFSGISINAGIEKVTLRPQTVSTTINLGGADSPGVLGLTDGELDSILAETLVIGDAANTGDITITAAIDPAKSVNLSLITGSAITINDAITVTGTFIANAGTDLTLAAGKTITVANGKPLALTVGAKNLGGKATISGDLVATSGATLNGGAGNDTFTVGALTANLTVLGKGGADALIAKLGAGVDLKANITYDGGAGADLLRVFGGSTQTVGILMDPTAGDPGRGKVTIGGGSISFSNLAPVDVVNVLTAEVKFNFSSVKADVAAGKDFLTETKNALRITPAAGGKEFESLAVWNTTKLVIDTTAVSGADVITVTGTNGATHNITNLVITTGAESGDEILFVGQTEVVGNITVTAGKAVTVSQNLKAGGNISLTTGPDLNDTGDIQNITLGSGVNVISTGGDVILTAADYLVATNAASIQAPNGSVILVVDAGAAETNPTKQGGKALLVLEDIVAKNGATLTGNNFNDEFTVSKYTTELTIDGKNGTDKVTLNAKNGAVTLNDYSSAQFVGGKLITFVNIEFIQLLNVADFVLNGTAGDDVLFIASNGGSPFYNLNGGNKIVLPTSLTSFSFIAGDGNDKMFVELTQATDNLSTIANQITYDGNAGKDILSISGSKQNATIELIPLPGNIGRGVITAGSTGILLFENLDPVDLVGFGIVTIKLGGIDDNVVVSPGLLFGDGKDAIVISGKTDGLEFETVALRDNTRIILNTLPSSGKDTVVITGTGDKTNHLNKSLEILSGLESNNVTIEGDVSLTSDLIVTSGTINVNVGTTTKVGGLVVLTANEVVNNGLITAESHVKFIADSIIVSNAVIAGENITFTANKNINAVNTSTLGGVITFNTETGDIVSESTTAEKNVVLTSKNGSIKTINITASNTGSVLYNAKNNILNGGEVSALQETVWFTTVTGSISNTNHIAAGIKVMFLAGTEIENKSTATIIAGSDVTFVALNGVTNSSKITAKNGSVIFTSKSEFINNLSSITAGIEVTFTARNQILNTDSVSAAQNVSFLSVQQDILNKGIITTTKGDILFQSAADIKNAAITNAGQDIRFIAGKQIVNSNVGNLTAGRDVKFEASLDITNEGIGLIIAGRDVRFIAGSDVTLLSSIVATGNLVFTAGESILFGSSKSFETKSANITANASENLIAGGATLKASEGTIALAIDTNSKGGGVADLRNAKLFTKSGVTATLVGNKNNDQIFIDAGYESLLRIDGKAGFDTLIVSGSVLSVSSCSVISPGRQFASYFNIEQVTLSKATDVTVLGDDPCPLPTPRADRVTLAKLATTYLITANGQSITSPALEKFSAELGSLDDCLILDSSLLGSDVFINGIMFVGGKGTNAVVVLGTGNESVNYLASKTALQATMTIIDKGTLTVTGTNGIDLQNFLKATVYYSNADDQIAVSGAKHFCLADQAIRISAISGGIVVPTLAVSKTTSLLIDTTTVDGNDSVIIDATHNKHLISNIEIQTGSGSDSVTIAGLVELAGNLEVTTGSVSVTTGSIKVGSNVSITTIDTPFPGQNITLATNSFVQAKGVITLLSGDDLQAAGATIEGSKVFIAIDAGNSDPGVGGVLNLVGSQIIAESVSIIGNSDADTFRVSSYSSPVIINGKDPTVTPGDLLIFDAQGKPITAKLNSFTTDKSQVSYINIETVQLINATVAITVTGSSNDDYLTISRKSSNFVYQFKGEPAVELFGMPTSFRFDGQAGKDALVVDYKGGDPVPSGGVIFDGGADDDLGLGILGTGNQSAVYLSNSKGTTLAGSVTVDGGVISFQNLTSSSQVDVTRMKSVTIGFDTTDDTILLNNAKDILLGEVNDVLIVGSPTGAFAKVGVWNNTSVTVDTTGKDGNDIISVLQADNDHKNIHLVILTGNGDDVASIVGPVLLSGNLTVVSPQIRVFGTTITSKMGGVTFGGAVQIIEGSAKVTAGNSGVQFEGIVNGPGALIVNTAGKTVFEQTVGKFKPLAALITDLGGSTTVSGGLIQTKGDQSYNDQVTFTSSTAFRTVGGNINFNQMLTPANAGLDLILSSPGADITITKDLGDSRPVGLVSIESARNVAFKGTLSAASLTQTAGSGTTLFGAAVVLSGSGANLTTQSVVVSGSLAATNGDVALNVVGDVTFKQSLATGNLTQTSGKGTTTFNGPVTLTGDVDLTTGTILFIAGNAVNVEQGNTSLRASRGVSIDGELKTITLVVGDANTNTRPVTQFNGAVALTGNADLVLATVIFNNNFDVVAGKIRLDSVGGASQTSGRILSQVLDLRGAGAFQLDQPENDLTSTTGALFANLENGVILFRDANDLTIRFRDLADNTIPAIRIGGQQAVLEVTTGEGFSALDTTVGEDGVISKDRPLIDVGAKSGQVRIFPGVNYSQQTRQDVTVDVVYVAETIAALGSVKIGVPLESDPDFNAYVNALAGRTMDPRQFLLDRANKAVDVFTVRPSQNTQTFIYGNEPVREPGQLGVVGDRLAPVFSGVTASQLSRFGDNGEFTFDPPFERLVFRSIEGLGGINLDVFVVQTAPRAGNEDGKDYAIRILGTAQTPEGQEGIIVGGTTLTVPISGGRVPPNPFVVSPDLTSPIAPFTGPRLAVADVNGDNIPDLIIANGAGDLPIVTVINGLFLLNENLSATLDFNRLAELVDAQGNRALISQFFAYEAAFTGGLTVAARDLNNDGKAEIITGPGPGGGQRVRIFQIDSEKRTPDGQLDVFANAIQFDEIQGKGDFFAFEGDPDFRGGVNVALGDINADGFVDIIVGAGVGGGPRVQVYSGKDGTLLRNFFAYDESFRGGVYVDAGFYDADAFVDIVTAPGPGGGPHIRVFRGYDHTILTPEQFADFFDVVQGPTVPVTPTTPLFNFFAFEPIETLVSGERQNRGGVSGVAFGSTSGGSGRNQSILASTPRGREVQILRFDPIQFARDGRFVPTNLLDDPFLIPIDLNGDGRSDHLQLRDGGAVAGFSEES